MKSATPPRPKPAPEVAISFVGNYDPDKTARWLRELIERAREWKRQKRRHRNEAA